MFNNPRFCTSGIKEEIPEYFQNLLWFLIDVMEVEKDYLQVFELSEIVENDIKKQKIIHKQENPNYYAEHVITLNQPLTTKIFVIDENTHSTMLYADEY